MAGINKVIIIGHLGQNPECKTLPNGDAACALSVATSESWTDQRTGEKVERTEWHRIVLYRRLAEIAGQYLQKGAKVYLEGKLRTRKWQAQDGTDRYTTEIIADQLQMLSSKAENTQTASTNTPKANAQAKTATPPSADNGVPFDDIPF